MIVVSKDGKRVTDFNNGVWEVDENEIFLKCAAGRYIRFASYETEEEATKEFEKFIDHMEDTNYYRFYCPFDITTKTLGEIGVNRFKVGDTVNDFSFSGIKTFIIKEV